MENYVPRSHCLAIAVGCLVVVLVAAYFIQDEIINGILGICQGFQAIKG
jgi:hypothetical protein